jgi:hypothetical protein
MSWGKKRIAGVIYKFDHLDPFTIEVTPKDGRTYKVRVSFGFHTFTRELKAEDGLDLHIRHGNETRCFCHDRYRLSFELKDMICYAAKGRVYFSQNSNFLIVESVSDESGPFIAVFNIQKAKDDGHDVAMFVTSAHLRPALPKRLPAVTFATLMDYKVRGRPLTPAPSRPIIAVKRK